MVMMRTEADSSMRRRVLSAVTIAAAMVAGSAACGQGDDAGAMSELAAGAQVRFQAPGYRSGWQTGMVGDAAGCTAIMVPDSPDSPSRFDVVPVDSVTRLQVRAPDGGRAQAAATTRGGRWKDVGIRAVHERYGGCSPFGMP